MTDLEMWSLLVGTAMPLLVAVLQQPQWSPRTRALVTATACLIAGGCTSWLAGQLSTVGVTTAVLTVLVAALATYRSFWRQTGVTRWIESATSPTPQPGPR